MHTGTQTDIITHTRQHHRQMKNFSPVVPPQDVEDNMRQRWRGRLYTDKKSSEKLPLTTRRKTRERCSFLRSDTGMLLKELLSFFLVAGLVRD
mmetsp:Transcript_18208/g.38942  ORF Transcript_18208/g.38942 Transcript_18208/m.38942 type:complete len:93 (-) Transcript_18208:1983-2261(-)